MTDNTQTPANSLLKIDSKPAYEEAVNTVIGNARTIVRIFDYNLEDGGYNSLRRFELLQAFLLASRNNRLYIVLHDVDYLTRFCPRMLALQRQFSHAISIHQITPEAKNVYDPFVLADQTHYVHRFHFDDFRASLALNDRQGAQALLNRFTEIWETSTPAVFASTLGL